jgi:hypothetical protein
VESRKINDLTGIVCQKDQYLLATKKARWFSASHFGLVIKLSWIVGVGALSQSGASVAFPRPQTVIGLEAHKAHIQYAGVYGATQDELEGERKERTFKQIYNCLN